MPNRANIMLTFKGEVCLSFDVSYAESTMSKTTFALHITNDV